jgi:hypothetical protein
MSESSVKNFNFEIKKMKRSFMVFVEIVSSVKWISDETGAFMQQAKFLTGIER